MKKHFLDTNVILRFLLKDNPDLFQKAKNYFQKAKQNKLALVVVPQVVFEVNYVLAGVYSFAKTKRVKVIKQIVSAAALRVERREILLKALDKYKECNIDLVDIYLWCLARQEKGEVVSFDEDFKKLQQGSR